MGKSMMSSFATSNPSNYHRSYVISDKVIERAIALDSQHGISSRFTSALKSFDEKHKGSDKAQAADRKLAATDRATAAWNGLNSYFDQAISTPTGQKLRSFYVEGSKQVMDVHNEARHLANLKSGKTGSAALPAADAPDASTTAPTEVPKPAGSAVEKPAEGDKV